MSRVNRREFLMGGCSLAAGIALAKPIRSVVGSSNLEWTEDGPVPTAADYIQDGLIALWDGIENIGLGEHLDGNTPWVNLVTGETINVQATYFFDGDHLDMTSNAVGLSTSFKNTEFRAKWSAAVDAREYTVEIVQGFYDPKPSSGYTPSVRQNFAPSLYGGPVFVNGTTPYGNVSGSGNGGYWISRVMPSGAGLGDHTLSLSVRPKGDVRLACNAYYDGEIKISNYERPGSGIADEDVTYRSLRDGSWYLGRTSYNDQSVERIYCMRFYNRQLSDAEIARNRRIDKARFGI